MAAPAEAPLVATRVQDDVLETAVEQGHDVDMLPTDDEPTAASSSTISKDDQDPEKLEHRPSTDMNQPADELGHDDLKAAEAYVDETPDPNIVDWDGPNDPTNPINFSMPKKSLMVFTLSIATLIAPLASSMFAPGVPQAMKEFHSSSNTLAEFVVSVYILGFAVGPLLIGPLSEHYGRYPVYAISNIVFVVFTVACALATNLNMLIVFRFFAGAFGVTPVTIGGGTIADLIRQEKRGAVMAIWAMGPLLGPVIGPVAGGYLTAALGWRWVFWVLSAVSAFFAAFTILFTYETYAPVLLERKAARLRKETSNPDLRSKLDSGLKPAELFKRAIVRPSKMLFLSPIVLLMSIYMAVIYGLLYLLFTTFTYVFEDDYGFSENNVGLVFIGVGLGMILGLVACGVSSDKIAQYLCKKHGGEMKPEYRLPALIGGAFFVPVGFFIYGWCAEEKVQWAAPLFGTLVLGIGIIIAFMCVQTYLIDAFTVYAASAIAANTVLRSIFGCVLPLCGLQMYATLGYGWGNSLLGFLALAMIPIPWFFFTYGERIRTNPKYQVNF